MITNGQASVNVPGFGVVTLYGVAPPQLTAGISAGGQLNLFWPPIANGFVLQSATSLAASSSWVGVGSGEMTTNGYTNGLTSITILPNNATTFYRLAQP